MRYRPDDVYISPANRLLDIKDKIKELLDEAKYLVKTEASKYAYERAKAYWINTIDNCLDSSPLMPCTMEDTANALPDEDEEDEE